MLKETARQKSRCCFIILFTLVRLLMAETGAAAELKVSDWTGDKLRGEATAFAVANDALTLTGTGKGFAFDGDDCDFVFINLPAGDAEISARVASIEGGADALTGIMIRAGDDTQTNADAIVLTYSRPAGKNRLPYIDWNVRENARQMGRGSDVRQTPPELWLRVVRMGANFAVFKSSNGRLWTLIGNTSGWAFAADQPLRVGFFAANSAGGKTTAVFDNIYVGRPHLEWKTSWVGDSFGNSPSDRHVPNGIDALYIGADGTGYSNAGWDEGDMAVCKFHRDGYVIKGFRDDNEYFGNSGAHRGTITGDGTHIYLVNQRHLYRTNLNGDFSATRRIDVDGKLGWGDAVSGLAISDGLLYFADALENRIRVANVGDHQQLFTAGNTEIRTTTERISVEGVKNAAPEKVYQSFRFNDGGSYVIPNLAAGVYTARLHFAQYDEITRPGMPVAKLNIDIPGTAGARNFDIAGAAGGMYKAAVLELPGATVGDDGRMNIDIHRGEGGQHILICGIEIINAAGERVFALNCTGSSVGGFKGESWELPERAFPFERPGAMVFDKRGDLWIIQKTIESQPGAIKCYAPDGRFTGRQITEVKIPGAIAYDPKTDRLLIAENGPDDNIRFYGRLESVPTFERSFGYPGGIMAGPHPGLADDPEAGGSARFHNISALGVDGEGSLYVNSSATGTNYRKFTVDGEFVWQLNAMVFCTTPDVDPDSDGAEIYSTYVHMRLDLDQTEPGKEWSYVGDNWDEKRFGPAPRGGNSQSIIRRVGEKRQLIQYTSAQGQVESAKIFRFEGEVVIACGEIRDNSCVIWIDDNGDGRESEAELRRYPDAPGGLKSFSVDDRGDIWMVMLGGRPHLRHFRFLGFNESGAPLYGFGEGEFEDISYPQAPLEGSEWGNLGRASYDPTTDVMILVAPSHTRAEDQENPRQYMARYDNWSSGAPVERWLIQMPDPDTDPDFSCIRWDQNIGKPVGLAHHFMGLDVAGDLIFFVSMYSDVNVFDKNTGERIMILSPGPEVAGIAAWEDAAQGLTAFRRANGEYLVFTECSGFGSKANFYRFRRD